MCAARQSIIQLIPLWIQLAGLPIRETPIEPREIPRSSENAKKAFPAWEKSFAPVEFRLNL
ncbi:hypothetical protein D3C73_1042710 [compost metagenome]